MTSCSGKDIQPRSQVELSVIQNNNETNPKLTDVIFLNFLYN